MITRLKKIKALGIFADFTWDTDLPAFGRYNVIYGWNGSGKTTLSKLFAGLPGGCVTSCPSLEYDIETGGGSIREGQVLPEAIRVFNHEYVTKNVYTVSGKATPILILGEDNKKIADAIAADEELLATKKEQRRKLTEQATGAAKQRDRLFSDIAKVIGFNTAGLATRNYRKPDAETDFATLSSKALLDDASVAARAADLKQQERPDIAEAELSRMLHDGRQESVDAILQHLNADGARLCAQTVESQIIPHLKANADIAAWVEQGLALHKLHSSTECEFCGQVPPSERLTLLAGHFNAADKRLKDEIDGLLRELEGVEAVIRAFPLPDKANLYDEIQGDYQTAVAVVTAAKSALLLDIAACRDVLTGKKAHTTESLTLATRLDISTFQAGLNTANAAMRRHNEKTANFQPVKAAARQSLQTHYLSTIYDEIKQLDGRLAGTKVAIQQLVDGNPSVPEDVGIPHLEERIKTNRATISSSHKGCEEINAALRTFLGREELQFNVDGDGYVLQRNGRAADGLSEGERTAIGVCHFIINLREQGFDPAEGIIVVDDPVSSLDSNSIFQAFAFLKNAVKDAKQVFFLTHDFDFLRLLLNWVKNSRQAAGYYMITDAFDPAGGRGASVSRLDRLLQDHETEYHYLFKRLYTFKTDGTLESVYDVPNIARKVLEAFLMFRVPSSQSPYAKLESLKQHFDENKLTAIYKFTNDQSHTTGKGFDPALVGETQKNVQYMLEMIEAVFPEHYEILVQSIKAY